MESGEVGRGEDGDGFCLSHALVTPQLQGEQEGSEDRLPEVQSGQQEEGTPCSLPLTMSDQEPRAQMIPHRGCGSRGALRVSCRARAGEGQQGVLAGPSVTAPQPSSKRGHRSMHNHTSSLQVRTAACTPRLPFKTGKLLSPYTPDFIQMNRCRDTAWPLAPDRNFLK